MWNTVLEQDIPGEYFTIQLEELSQFVQGEPRLPLMQTIEAEQLVRLFVPKEILTPASTEGLIANTHKHFNGATVHFYTVLGVPPERYF